MDKPCRSALDRHGGVERAGVVGYGVGIVSWRSSASAVGAGTILGCRIVIIPFQESRESEARERKEPSYVWEQSLPYPSPLRAGWRRCVAVRLSTVWPSKSQKKN